MYPGEWRVERYDDHNLSEVAIFSGRNARERDPSETRRANDGLWEQDGLSGKLAAIFLTTRSGPVRLRSGGPHLVAMMWFHTRPYPLPTGSLHGCLPKSR